MLDAYIEVCESASKTSVQKYSQYIFDIQDKFLSTFVGILKMQGVDCKTFVFFSFQRAEKGHRNGVISWYRHFKL